MSILHVMNGDLEAPVKQIHLADVCPEEFTQFTEDEFRDDFEEIMEEDINRDGRYRHGVVVYEAKNMRIEEISFLVLDADFDTVYEYSLKELLKPDFSELTAEYDIQNNINDVHSLVSVKAGVLKDEKEKTEKQPLVSHKRQEVNKQA